MLNFNTSTTSKEIIQFVSRCKNEEELISKLKKNFSFLVEIIQSIDCSKEVKPLTSKLLYILKEYDLDNSSLREQIKELERTLRNRNMLHFEEVNISSEEENPIIRHFVVLSCEIPYFAKIFMHPCSHLSFWKYYKDFASEEVWNQFIEYHYQPDEKRVEFLSKIDKKSIPQILNIASYWSLDSLVHQCDDILCSSIEEIFDVMSLKDLLELAKVNELHKFKVILDFVQKRVNEGMDPNEIASKIKDPEKMWDLLVLCDDKEIKVFSTIFSNSF